MTLAHLQCAGCGWQAPAGLAALIKVAGNSALRDDIGLGADARVFLINTEGATDPKLYETLVHG